jgi:hypothetical protein
MVELIRRHLFPIGAVVAAVAVGAKFPTVYVFMAVSAIGKINRLVMRVGHLRAYGHRPVLYLLMTLGAIDDRVFTR